MNEWQFTQTATNSGDLTYRCICLHITADADDFTDSELLLMKEITDTLNQHYVNPSDDIITDEEEWTDDRDAPPGW